jgi:dTDP-4-dehydrorhamnose reductase
MASGRVLITGAAGMLGSQLFLDAPPGVEPLGTDLRPAEGGAPPVAAPGVDLAEPAEVERLFAERGPFGGVLHAAAYTAVDQAEAEEALAHRVNAIACGVLARACAQRRIPLLVVSTDFVFDGAKRTPYREDDPVAPLGAYGRTKRAGEEAALAAWPAGARVVRTQWLYGPRGKHFPGTIVRLAREKGALSVVDDQIGSPTSTLELSPALWDVLARGAPGVYHAACEGQASWFDLARESVRLAGLAERVKLSPCTTAQFPRPAPRPAYSVLDCAKLARLRGRPLRAWTDALVTFFEQAGPVGSEQAGTPKR